ncbi:MAG: hypothetical protein J3K34DRAFT_461081 [Monoraphidium minutum]|nr:MAG: hypothetical protein J3K34DRAFT_461081 [Monoraphidium minutum]
MSFARCLMPVGRGWSCTAALPSTSGACAAAARPAAARAAAPRRPQPNARRLCAAAGARPPAREMLMVAPENRAEVAVILDLADQAAKGWALTWSRFVTPPVAADALAAIAQLADVSAVAWGGYPQAERCRIVIGRDELLAAAQADPSGLGGVAALDIRGNFMFDPANHRDFLGALLGTGIVRDRVGDVLVMGEGGAQALVDAELAEHFEAELTKVRSVSVEARSVPLSALRVPPQQVTELSSIEASMRLDAVASAGFRMGRSAMADLIKGGDVRVNWREAKKPSVEVKEGDVVSVAGRGRLEIRGVSKTKKDKFAVKMARLVAYRPSYPPELYDRILSFAGLKPAPPAAVDGAPDRGAAAPSGAAAGGAPPPHACGGGDGAQALRPARLAVDVATGSGQAARDLAARFPRVLALDASAAQLAAAPPGPAHLEFRTADAHATGLPDGAADVIAVAQALHWLDRPRFFAEARRALADHGTLAAWCYGLAAVEAARGSRAADDALREVYGRELGPYWDERRRLVERMYEGMEPEAGRDFEVVERQSMEMRREVTVDGLVGYVSSWSSYGTFCKERGAAAGEQLLSTFRARVLAALGPAASGGTRVTLVTPIALILARGPLPAAAGGGPGGR